MPTKLIGPENWLLSELNQISKSKPYSHAIHRLSGMAK
jgi:hypothetical protein